MLVNILGFKKFILGLAKKIKHCKPIETYDYVIYPQRIINITQRANGSFSHLNLEAWDLADKDSAIQDVYAPCTVKALAKPASNANTVLFGSCDLLGHPKEVITEDGNKHILTFALTHDDYIDDIEIGHVYKSGEIIYQEGKAGKTTGNHVHLEVAEGWQYEKVDDKYGNYRIENIIKIGDVFHFLKGWNTIKKANGYTFREVTARSCEVKE